MTSKPTPLQLKTALDLASRLEFLISSDRTIKPTLSKLENTRTQAHLIASLWSESPQSAARIGALKISDPFRTNKTLPLFTQLVLTCWDQPHLWSEHLTEKLCDVFWTSLPGTLSLLKVDRLRPFSKEWTDPLSCLTSINLIARLSAPNPIACERAILKIYANALKIASRPQHNEHPYSKFQELYSCAPLLAYGISQGFLDVSALPKNFHFFPAWISVFESCALRLSSNIQPNQVCSKTRMAL
jgi:hypothetical protein